MRTETGSNPTLGKVIGRYALYDEIAAGGMATVHIGRLIGPAGFSRTVAIKRMHGHLAKDPEFVSMFMDEARLAGRIRHPNVVGTIDIVALSGELFLVMEYVHGESLHRLLKAASAQEQLAPLPVISAIVGGALDGLHAAHEAVNDRGEPLCIVHRDVSPHNIIVGAADGIARVLDFGIAKATDRAHSTRDGTLKGKLHYMAPEQVYGSAVDRTADIYAACVILWEAVTGRRLFSGKTDAQTLSQVLAGDIPSPSQSTTRPLPSGLDELIVRGLSRRPSDRLPTARELARALQRIVPPAPASDVADWVGATGGDPIEERARRVALIEQATPSEVRVPSWRPPQNNSQPTVVAPPSRPPRINLKTAQLPIIVGAIVAAAYVVETRSAPTPPGRMTAAVAAAEDLGRLQPVPARIERTADPAPTQASTTSAPPPAVHPHARSAPRTARPASSDDEILNTRE